MPSSRCQGGAMDFLSGQFDAETLSQFVLARAHPAWLGLRYNAHGENWCELELPWREDLVGEGQTLVMASGPIISLLDMTAGAAIWVTNGEFKHFATLDLRVDYLRASRDQSSIVARSECYRRTRSAIFVRGRAHDGNPSDPVAAMSAVFVALDPARMRAQ